MIPSTWLRFCFALAGVCVFFLGAARPASAADKDVIELQREVAGLSDQVHNLQIALSMLQSTFDQRLGAQGALLQQTLDGVNQIRTDSAVETKTVAGQLSQQEQKIAIPVAALNAKIDQMIVSFSAAQENISDMNSRLGRLEQQIVDLANVVKVLQAPTPAPPTGLGSGMPATGAPASGVSATGGPPPGVTAEGLYQDATRDELSGKPDLALQEYTQYLQYFGDTDKAADAQFQIGEIQYHQGNADQAIQAFDAVVSHFPDSTHAPDALYEKAQALKSEGQRTSATEVLNRLVLLYPESDAAGRAKADLAAAQSPKK
ncbi:MAG TPA: tetratricopeptide repeat protein [Bryobacteraceae bacterium]|nr:tetratricopeptide repeat protein [Bryobacteraceae bacterium]